MGGTEQAESVTLVFQDWCDWCDCKDVDLTHKIEVGRMNLTARFCSLQCAARWGCAADQNRIEERSVHTGTDREGSQ